MFVKLVLMFLILGLIMPQYVVSADKTSAPLVHLDKASYSLYSRVNISIYELEADEDPLVAEKIYVDIETKNANLIGYTLTEIGSKSGNFSGHITLTGPDGITEGIGPLDGRMRVDRGDHLLVSYVARSGELITASGSIDYHIGRLSFDRDTYSRVVLADEDLNVDPDSRDILDNYETMLLLSAQEGNKLYFANVNDIFMLETDVNSGIFVGYIREGECDRCVGLNENGDTLPFVYHDLTLPEPYDLIQEQNQGIWIFAITQYIGRTGFPIFDPAYLFLDGFQGNRDFIVNTQSPIRDLKFLKYDYKIEFINSATKADTMQIQIPRKMLKEIDLVRINYTKAHFSLKQIDANYLNIELKYPAGINYIEILDTDQTNPIDLLEPKLLSEHTILTELREGGPVIIQSELRNHGKQNHALTYLVKVNDEDGVTVFIDSVRGFSESGESIAASIKWIPEQAGNYKIETFVWSDLNNPSTLASPQSMIVTVTGAEQESFKLLSKWRGGEDASIDKDGVLDYAQSIALDIQGSLYVSYQGIQKFSSNGTFVKKLDEGGLWLWHLTSDRSGNILAVESTGKVKRFDAEGKLLAEWQLKEKSRTFFDIYVIAVDSNNSVFVADLGTEMILKFNSKETFVTAWGGACSLDGHSSKAYTEDPCRDPDGSGPLEVGDGQFYGIRDIAVDAEGFVYATDMQNHRVQKFTNDGKFVLKWGTRCVYSSAREDPNCKDLDGDGPLRKGEGQFSNPMGVAADKLGYVYVSDSNQHVQKFTKNGEFVASWGSYCNMMTGVSCIDPDDDGSLEWGDGQFASPTDIAVDSSGFVYVLDNSNARVQKFANNGKFVTKLGKTNIFNILLSFPEAIALDKHANVYIAGGPYSRILKFSSSGTPLMRWGDGGSNLGALRSPTGITVSGDGYVYVADTGNNRVQKFGNGKFVYAWGSNCVLGNNFHGCIDPDGLGALQVGDGQFNSPSSIGTDTNGNIYVFDGNGRIQKFDSDGRFITKWGSFCALFGYSPASENDVPIPRGEGCIDPDGVGPLKVGDGQFMSHAYIAVDPNGYLYVSDTGNNRTQKFTLDGKFLMTLDYYGPIAADEDGDIYVIDISGGYVTKFGAGGNIIARFTLDEFEAPRGIAVDNTGNIYVVDRNLSMVQKYSPIVD